MITITEKRLQELEHRIPVYEAMITQLNLKLQAVNTFPEDIQALKEICKQVVADMQGNTSNISLLRTELSNTSNNLRGQDELFSKSLANVKQEMSSYTALDTFVLHANDTRKQLAELISIFSLMKAEIEGLKKADAKAENDTKNIAANLSAYTQNADLFKKAAIEATAFSTSMVAKIEELKDNSKSLKDALYVSTMDLQRLILSKEVELERKIPKEAEQKNYDTDISDLKKDMAVLLTAVHTTSKDAPEQSKIDVKVKLMEKSIAQIYELLKKYER